MIQIDRPDDEHRPFADLARENPGLFQRNLATNRYWTGAHMIAIKEADAVITIGGGRSTYITGLAAIIAGKLLIPVGAFGGASEKLLWEIDTLADIEPERFNALKPLREDWTPDHLDRIAHLAGINRPKILIIHGRSDDRHKLEGWLRRTMSIDDIVVMQDTYSFGKALPDKFEELANGVNFAVALATADDRGGLDAEIKGAIGGLSDQMNYGQHLGVRHKRGPGRTFGWKSAGFGDGLADTRCFYSASTELRSRLI